MSNLNLQKLCEWVWLWPWTFKPTFSRSTTDWAQRGNTRKFECDRKWAQCRRYYTDVRLQLCNSKPSYNAYLWPL